MLDDPLLRSTLLKVAAPAFGLVVGCRVFSRRRGPTWREDLGLVAPLPAAAAIWIAGWIAWIVASEWIIEFFGLPDAKPWPEYAAYIVAMRVLALGVLGPALEELVFRGVFFFYLARTRIGPYGAIVILAAIWSALHVRYGVPAIALIFVDGVLFGLARHTSKSLTVPIAMHMIGNLVSVWQSTHAA